MTGLSFRRHVFTFLLGLAGAAATVILFLAIGRALPRGEVYRVKAALPTSASLVPGSRVTMAGARVGTVRSIEREELATVVEMEIDDDRVTPIPEDTEVSLRQRTPVGETYIALRPGSSKRMLPSGGALPISQAEEYVDVDELLSVLQGDVRRRARQVIRGLGRGLEGRGGELNAVLDDGTAVLRSGSRIFTRLARDREQVAGVVDRLGRLFSALGERSEAIRVIARDGFTAVRALASRDRAMRRVLDELPPTVEQVRTSSDTLASVSQTATPVVGELAKAVAELRPAVNRLLPALQEGRAVVRELGAVAKPAEGTVDRLKRAAGPLAKALPPLTLTVCELAPMIRYTKPYTGDAIATLIGLGSASNSYDALGHLIRLDPIVSENTISGLPEEVNEARHTLLRSGLLGELTPLTWNPYPKPGQIGKDYAGKPGTPNISGPKALARSGWKFPRLMPDC